jgi:CRISPR-associated protein Csx14
VFACLGLVEAADVVLGDVEGAFDWSVAGETRFRLRASGDESPVARVLRFLDEAEVTAVVPAGSKNVERWSQAWGMQPEVVDPKLGYPFPDPSSPATLACVLFDGHHRLTIEHWGDATRDNVKFWAGAGGYPGAALARDALALVRGRAAAGAADPFSIAAPQSSSFRFDWRRDYIPIDAGFSLNSHGHISTVGYPLVELLAAVGLNHARPMRPDRRNKLEYAYAVVGQAEHDIDIWLPPSLLRVALGRVPLPFPTRRFRMLLDWPGQEGQARSITTVTEEMNE